MASQGLLGVGNMLNKVNPGPTSAGNHRALTQLKNDSSLLADSQLTHPKNTLLPSPVMGDPGEQGSGLSRHSVYI